MRKIIIGLIFIISFFGFSQENDANEITFLYEKAIQEYVNRIQENFDEGISTIEPKDLYFIAKGAPMKNLPQKAGNYKVRYINPYEKSNKKLLKKGIRAVIIHPLILKKNKITISFVSSLVSYKRNTYNFGKGGGSKTKFEYSCKQEKWVCIETDFYGI